MEKLDRITGKLFGATADPTDDPTLGPEIGQFGSALAGTYNGTSDVATIQALPAWANGFIDAVTPTNQYPPLPEMTGFGKVLSYQQNYLLQRGIPEWDSATDYYENCFCAYGNTIYISLQDNNTNNEPDVSPQYWEVYGAVTDYANQDLSNLTNFGNARLQWAPFAINQGTVLNGENNTLRFPEGSQATEYVTGTVEGYGHHTSGGGYTVTRTFDSPKLLTDITATYNLFPDYNSRCTTTLRAILSDDSSLQIGTYTHVGRANYSHTDTYTFNTPTTVKALQMYVGISGNGSAGIIDISFTEQISVTAGDSVICDPCTITTCDGRTKKDLGSAIYDVTTTADGNYYILKDFETGELSLASSLTIAKTPPLLNVATAANCINSTSNTGSVANAFDGSAVAGTYLSLYEGSGVSISGKSYIGQSGLTEPVKMIKLYQGGLGSNTYNCCITSAKVQISSDGTTWTDVQTVNGLKSGNDSTTTCYLSEITVKDYTMPSNPYQMRLLANSGVASGNTYSWIINEIEFCCVNTSNANYLDYSTFPANLYINGTLNNNLVYIGNCIISSGAVTTVTNREFNDSGYVIEKANKLVCIPDYSKNISIVSTGVFKPTKNGVLLVQRLTAGSDTSYVYVYKGTSNSGTRLLYMGGSTTGYNEGSLILRKDEDYYIVKSGSYMEATFYPFIGE